MCACAVPQLRGRGDTQRKGVHTSPPQIFVGEVGGQGGGGGGAEGWWGAKHNAWLQSQQFLVWTVGKNTNTG